MSLTPEDLRTLVYFHQHKGDITSCTTWEKKRDQIGAEFPHVLQAHQNLLSAQKTLDACVRDMERAADFGDDE